MSIGAHSRPCGLLPNTYIPPMRHAIPLLLTSLLSACTNGDSTDAACFNPFGCQSKTLTECRADASRRPSDMGVKIAMEECQRIFVDEPAEKLRAAATLKMNAAWSDLDKPGVLTLAEVKRRVGSDPIDVSKPGPCTHFESLPDADGPCVLYRWRDGGNSYYYRQLEIDSKSGLVWSISPDPITADQLHWR